jgi:hypothetical protein
MGNSLGDSSSHSNFNLDIEDEEEILHKYQAEHFFNNPGI